MIRILLAEDNLADILLVKQALRQHEIAHELHVVNDGAAALDYIARIGSLGNPPCPDVLLLDLNLPKIDGPEVLREFRKRGACFQTPVIVVSSSETERDRARMAMAKLG